MRELIFSLEEGSNKLVVRVIDQETKEIIREIPAEEMRGIMEDLVDGKNRAIEKKR